MDTTYRPSLLSDGHRARWLSPAFAALLHAGAAAAFVLVSLAEPAAVMEEPTITVELVPMAAPQPSPVAEPAPTPPPPAPAPAPVAKPVPAPAPKLAVKAAAPIARPTTPTAPPSETPSPAAFHEAAAQAPAAPSPTPLGPAGAEQVAFVPPSASAAYLTNPKPQYPMLARRNGWEGVVRLVVEVDEDGRPVTVAVKDSSGHSVLDHCAQAAVRQWRFTPARRGGQQVAASVEVPIRFDLNEG